MRSIKRALCALAVAAVAMSLVPASAQHCQSELVIFTGFDAGGGNRRGLNAGAVGCNADSSDESLNTNYIVPGAQIAIVGAFTSQAPLSGTLDVGGVVTELTFTNLNNRWESQSVALSGGDAKATIVTPDGATVSVTYKDLT